MFGRSQNTLFPQPASTFVPVNLKEAAAGKDKVFKEQAAAYNRDKSELKQLLPSSSVQCPKTGSWENIGTVLEIRPDKLSYLIDIEGKMFIRARYMLWPVEEGGVSDACQSQVQVQGGAQAACQEGVLPRRSERLKLQKGKEELKSISKCAAPTTMMPSSVNTGASTICTGSNWQSSTTSSRRTILSDKTQGDYLLLTCSGQVLPLGRRPFLSSPSSHSLSLSAAGSGPKECAGACTVTGSSWRPSLQPSCQGRQLERDPVPLSPKASPWRQLNGSGPLQVGQACRFPTSLPQDLGQMSSCHFPSFPQSPMTGRLWSGEGTRSTPSPGRILVSSRTRFSIVPSESESEEEQQFVASRRSSLHASEPTLHPIRKTVGKKRSTGVQCHARNFCFNSLLFIS